MNKRICSSCGEDFYIFLRACPHCAEPSYFPNVDLANSDVETIALQNRYDQQVQNLNDLETKTFVGLKGCVESSTACKGMPRWELDRLISSDTATAATYYQQITGRGRIPDDNRWDRLRRIADASFFESFGEDIHFAALSTKGKWLENYGDGAIFFKEKMIAHRATVFENNTAMWISDNNGSLTIPPGFRSSWKNRVMLAIAKLIESACKCSADFDSLLLSNGQSSAEDNFMEVHICGGFTIRSASSIIIRKGALSELGRKSAIERANSLSIQFSEL